MTTPTIDQLAAQVAALQRDRDRTLTDIPDRAEYLQACAARQTEEWQIRRERARRGAEARDNTLNQAETERARLNARLAKIGRERSAELEKHDQARRQLSTYFDDLAAGPTAQLNAITENANAAARAAEAAPVEIDPPKVALGIDHSSTIASTRADRPRRIGRRHAS